MNYGHPSGSVTAGSGDQKKFADFDKTATERIEGHARAGFQTPQASILARLGLVAFSAGTSRLL